MNFTQYLRQLAADHRESGYTATAQDLDEAAARLEDAAELFHEIANAAEETADVDAALREIGRTASAAALDMVTR